MRAPTPPPQRTCSDSPSARPRGAAQDGWTPLHGAAVEGALGTVRLLLERGADARATNFAGRTPLDCARDESTRIVMRITHVLEPLRRAPGGGGTPVLAAHAPAAAPPPPQQAAAASAVADWFAALALPLSYATDLGCATVAELAQLTEDDLKEVGMKPAERRRLLVAAAHLLDGAPAAPAPLAAAADAAASA